MYKPLGKRIFDKADRVIAVSEYEKQLLLKDFSLDKDKISVIPNGIDLSEFNNLGRIPRESKTILCISRLERYKGVQYIIQTLPLLDKEFHLEIVGKGPYKAKLVKLIDELGLSNRVRFYQDLPRQELVKMYARAGIFILLSRYESFSIVVAEALAAKTPCIVANASALSEWIDDKNCFGIDYPIDKAKLAELITKAIGIEVGNVKLWDWDDVVKELRVAYNLGSNLL